MNLSVDLCAYIDVLLNVRERITAPHITIQVYASIVCGLDLLGILVVADAKCMNAVYFSRES